VCLNAKLALHLKQGNYYYYAILFILFCEFSYFSRRIQFLKFPLLCLRLAILAKDVGLVGNLLSASKSKMLGETTKSESFAELL